MALLRYTAGSSPTSGCWELLAEPAQPIAVERGRSEQSSNHHLPTDARGTSPSDTIYLLHEAITRLEARICRDQLELGRLVDEHTDLVRHTCNACEGGQVNGMRSSSTRSPTNKTTAIETLESRGTEIAAASVGLDWNAIAEDTRDEAVVEGSSVSQIWVDEMSADDGIVVWLNAD